MVHDRTELFNEKQTFDTKNEKAKIKDAEAKIAEYDEKIKELKEKLKKQKRISEILNSCWHAAAQWGELDTDSEVWPDEIAELEKLGYYEKE
jgi:oligopeptide transport system ATP-binding protein